MGNSGTAGVDCVVEVEGGVEFGVEVGLGVGFEDAVDVGIVVGAGVGVGDGEGLGVGVVIDAKVAKRVVAPSIFWTLQELTAPTEVPFTETETM